MYGESPTPEGVSAPNTPTPCNYSTQKQGTCLCIQSSRKSHVRVRLFGIHDPCRKERHKKSGRPVETARGHTHRRAVRKGRGAHAVKTMPRLHALSGKVHARTRTAQGDLLLVATVLRILVIFIRTNFLSLFTGLGVSHNAFRRLEQRRPFHLFPRSLLRGGALLLVSSATAVRPARATVFARVRHLYIVEII